MGFFSWKCSKTGESIPAYPHAGRPQSDSDVVLVLPDNTRIRGIYNGYGEINGVDVYEALAPFLGLKTREDVFSDEKFLTSPEGKKLTINQFFWDKPLSVDGKWFQGGMNEMRGKGWQFETHFDRATKLIKIVRADALLDSDTYEILPVSEDCPNQGFFYDDFLLN